MDVLVILRSISRVRMILIIVILDGYVSVRLVVMKALRIVFVAISLYGQTKIKTPNITLAFQINHHKKNDYCLHLFQDGNSILPADFVSNLIKLSAIDLRIRYECKYYTKSGSDQYPSEHQQCRKCNGNKSL